MSVESHQILCHLCTSFVPVQVDLSCEMQRKRVNRPPWEHLTDVGASRSKSKMGFHRRGSPDFTVHPSTPLAALSLCSMSSCPPPDSPESAPAQPRMQSATIKDGRETRVSMRSP